MADSPAWILATYPFVTIGALVAFILCFVSVVKGRRTRIALWWLFMGICLNMAALAAENFFWAYARLSPDYRLLTENVPIIVTTKMLHATGVWFHIMGAASTLLDKGWEFVRDWTIAGIGVLAIAYPLLVYLTW